jgi:hypothetical protein
MDGPALFQETQSFRRNPWAAFAVAGVLAAVGALLGSRVPLPATGWLGLCAGGSVALLLLVAGLDTEVRLDGLYVRFRPFTRRRRIGWREIVRAEACRYRPLREYGGWGIRFGPRGKAYNVHGDRGVRLELTDGRRLLIGSQRPDELAAAIAAAQRSAAR